MTDATILKLRFDVGLDTGKILPVPRYNAAPSQFLPVISNADPKNVAAYKWGIHPKWLTRKDGLINVRAETIKEKHTFSTDFAKRRCLVLADGFYEWKTSKNGPKQPFRITLKNGEPFAFAGIWEENEDINTFAIITTEPNDVIKPIHNRMPVILNKDLEKVWLSPNLDLKDALGCLTPYPANEMISYLVSVKVNNAKIDEPSLVVKQK